MKLICFILISLLPSLCSPITMPPPRPPPHNDNNSGGICSQESDFSLVGKGWIKAETKPQACKDMGDSFHWKISDDSPAVELTICEYASIRTVSFLTFNVRNAFIKVNYEDHYGRVDEDTKMVKVDGGEGVYEAKVGARVRIQLKPQNPSLPVNISNLIIRNCNNGYDCFKECSLYQVDDVTSCFVPQCTGDPCKMSCKEGQECRLINERNTDLFPSLQSNSHQLWACVDANRTDYGCIPSTNEKNDEGCPAC